MTLPTAERPTIQSSTANLNDLLAADTLIDLGEHLQTEPNDDRLIIDGLQITNERQSNNTEPNPTQRLNEPSTPTTRPTPALRRAQHRQAFVSRPSNPLSPAPANTHTTNPGSRFQGNSFNTPPSMANTNDQQLIEPSTGLLSRLDRPATLHDHRRRPAIFVPIDTPPAQPGAFRQSNTTYMQPPGIQQVVHHDTLFSSQGSITNPAHFLGDIRRGISSEVTNERGTPFDSEYIPVATPYFEATVEPLQDATRLQRNSQGNLLNDVGEPEFLQEAEVTDITIVNRPNQRPDAAGGE